MGRFQVSMHVPPPFSSGKFIPETLGDRSSVQKLLNHAQYDGGGFR
jgi:hypothetical protein